MTEFLQMALWLLVIHLGQIIRGVGYLCVASYLVGMGLVGFMWLLLELRR